MQLRQARNVFSICIDMLIVPVLWSRTILMSLEGYSKHREAVKMFVLYCCKVLRETEKKREL
jgi:hypothetical protein